MSRARSSIIAPFALAMLLVALCTGLVAAGCGSDDSATTLPPITGIIVRAETLSSGHGCGTAPSQLFKYTVLVFGLNADDVAKPAAQQRHDEFVGGNVNDCFTDGTFVTLPQVAGSFSYSLEVYAYNRAAYVAAGGSGLDATLQRLQNNRVALLADGGGAQERAAIQADLALVRATNPTYSTTCRGDQLDLVQSVAVCKPLQLGGPVVVGKPPPPPASVELRLAKFPKADNTFVNCDDQYASVHVSYTVGSVRAAPVDKRCSTLGEGGLVPATITVSPAQAPASYVFDVTLLRPDGTSLGSTTCGADTSPGLAAVADCKPLP